MVAKNQTALIGSTAEVNSGVALVREAGMLLPPTPVNVDSFTEWLSLMEVVQMLCPEWPVRDTPMRGTELKLLL
jgi:hypothetical protein